MKKIIFNFGLSALCFLALGLLAACHVSNNNGVREPFPGAQSKVSDAANMGTVASTEDVWIYHNDRQRTGWNDHEAHLTPDAISRGKFGPLWNSPILDSVTVDGESFEPHLFASPLYLDQVQISAGDFAGKTVRVVYAASTNAFVYAIAAEDISNPATIAPGTILWKTRLGTPIRIRGFDGALPLGVLSTPVIDTAAVPPRIYVTSVDATKRWQAFALDATSGAVLPGWPIQINNDILGRVNENGPAVFQGALAASQRGALNLSVDGRFLYVPFGAYNDGGAGFMAVIDTQAPAVTSSYAGAPTAVAFANGGMWSAGGPSVDANGRLYTTTGNTSIGSEDKRGFWGQSVLTWDIGATGRLMLRGTYTPWNYCQMDKGDVDLAGSAPMLIPELDPTTTATPHLIAFGGKQGNVYLLDVDHFPGHLDKRQPCGTQSSNDTSLMPPNDQPQFHALGPLNVFGPYSEDFNNGNFAKMRTTTAYFHRVDGPHYLFATGSSRSIANTTDSIPPGVVRLKIVTEANKPAFLAIDKQDTDLKFLSPSSPVITSNGGSGAVLWMLDANVLRVHSLHGPGIPRPILYAVDADSLKPLWQSKPDDLNVSGKYMVPAIARGTVFVGTDRIQAFGLQSGVGP